MRSNHTAAAAAAAKSLQSCPTLWDPIDGSPSGSAVAGIFQAGTLEWVPIFFSMHESEKSKWSRSVMSDSSWPCGLQPTRLLRPWNFPGKSTGVGCHCLLRQLFQVKMEACLNGRNRSWVPSPRKYKMIMQEKIRNAVLITQILFRLFSPLPSYSFSLER